MSKPTVTLTFAGDSAKLEQAMDRVGSSTQRMSREVGDSSDRVRRNVGDAFSSAGEAVDPYEGRMQGVSDVTSGVVDGLKGLTDESLSVSERLQLLGGAGADLAGGMAYLLPFVGQLATVLKVGLGSALSFIAAHPIVFALLAIAAILVLLWMRSETFREIVMRVFNAVADFTMKVLGGAWNWLVDKFSAFVQFHRDAIERLRGWFAAGLDWIIGHGRRFLDFYLGMPGRLIDAFASVGNGIRNAFRAAFNFVSDAWNNTIGRLSWSVPGWVPGIGGSSISAPRLPRFHIGGVVPGMPGQEVLAVLQAGERVSTSTGSTGALRVVFAGDTDGAFATAFMELVRTGLITLEPA